MYKSLAVAAAIIGGLSALSTSAMADRICGPGFYYRYHECRPYGYREGYYETAPGAVVGGAGYVAGSAVNAAGNVAGAAVGTAGAIVNSVLPH